MTNLAARSVLAIALLFDCAAAAAAPAAGLYRTQAVVTGQGEANRASGLAQCIADVVVKVSGDQRLIGDPRVAAMAREPEIFVKGFSYRDRLEGTPVHDEQGTYDRPHDLIVDFDPSAVNAALGSMGRKPWIKGRPELLVRLTVRKNGASTVVTSDGERDRDMRDSFSASAERLGLSTRFPESAALATLGAASDATPLDGTLTWSDAAHGWIADWRVVRDGQAATWRVSGVGFDEAFRNGLRGAAQVFSGSGVPR